MTDLRTAAQQALEALEGGADSWERVGPAIDALKEALVEDAMQKFTDVSQEIEAALAEPVQEPVWVCPDSAEHRYQKPGHCEDCGKTLVQERHFCPRCGKRTNGIHTCTPPAPLTDEVIADLWHQNGGFHHHFARAIERWLRGHA